MFEIVYIDADPLWRRLVERSVRSLPAVSCHVFSSLQAMRESLADMCGIVTGKPGPDFVITDVALPDAEGASIITWMNSLSPTPIVLFLTGHADILTVDLIRHSGPAGFALKDENYEDHIVAAVSAAQRGARFVSKSAHGLLERARRSPLNKFLSDREKHVLKLVGRSVPVMQIAREMGCSPVTIRRHLQHLRRKLDCDTTAALMQFAWMSGLGPVFDGRKTEPIANARSSS
ncbi:MAG TPA: response regulator transcription factor [Opitutaceae bacterium]|nr:response regulator transcription factor [Opitutaceae bacterium]